MIPSLETVVVLETFTRVTPLGVRFWDVVLAAPVKDELVVTAYSPLAPGRRVQATVNPSAVHILQNVPGLPQAENGAGDQAYWNNVLRQPFIIEVVDPRQQFLPFTFAADLPQRRLYTWACSPPASPPTPIGTVVPVYSTPSRTFPSEMALIRADLFDPQANTPAAWAVLEAYLDGQLLGRSIADARGSVALAFDYPEPIDFLPDSPLASGIPLTQQQWTIQLRAAYTPLSETPAIPDLCYTLEEQAVATLWQTWQPPAGNINLTEATLNFGRPLVLRSQDAGGTPLSLLYITP